MLPESSDLQADRRARIGRVPVLQKLSRIRATFRGWLLPTALIPVASLLVNRRATRSIASIAAGLEVRLELRANGLVVRAPLLDSWPTFEVFALGEYDLAELQWANIHWIIDCGAHVGSFSLWAANRCDARIVAIEPNPRAYRLLEQNLMPLESRVSVIRAALASRRGQRLLEDKGFPALSALTEAQQRRGFNVEAITFQDVLMRSRFPRVDLLKMDIEGGEQEVFEAMPITALESIHAAVIECHPAAGTNMDLIESKLRDSGMQVRTQPRLIVSWRV